MRLCKMTEDKYWCCWGRWYGSNHSKECRLYKTKIEAMQND